MWRVPAHLLLQRSRPRPRFDAIIDHLHQFDTYNHNLLGARFASKMSRLEAVTISTLSKPYAQPEDAKEKRHHNKQGKGFTNPWNSFEARTPLEIAKWALLSSGKNVKTSSSTAKIRKPAFLPTRQNDSLRATWLGHACYYVEFPSGLRVLFDPVFTQRCGPYGLLGPKRYTEAPCQVDDIPFIDVIVISHNHYDHLSQSTLTRISQKHPNAHFFVPLGNKQWFDKLGFRNVTELDWWEDREITVKRNDANKPEDISAVVSCLPAQHGSGRAGYDASYTLWASWSVSSGGKKLWFGGDTGYRTVPAIPPDEFDYGEKFAHLPHCPAFEQIGELRGPFDLGLIPIGAYHPRYLMSPVHANPYDSVNIFVDTECKRALGIHWGTWVLTDEEVDAPPKVLRQALAWKGLDEQGVFDTCGIGESREF